jgi:hypothetical protein
MLTQTCKLPSHNLFIQMPVLPAKNSVQKYFKKDILLNHKKMAPSSDFFFILQKNDL